MLVQDSISGNIIACDANSLVGMPHKWQPFTAYVEGSVAPQLWNLFQASPQMYQKLTACYAAFEQLSQMFETLHIPDDNPFAKLIHEQQESILLAQQCVQSGVMPTALAFQAEQERKNRG